MRIYLHGRDNIGWSIDSDRRHAGMFIKDLGHTITGNPFIARLVHSVWWNQLLSGRDVLLRFNKNIITTATNNIDPSNEEYKKAKKWVNAWVAPSRRQLERLWNDGVKAFYQPFYVNERIFRKLDLTRQEIAASLGINFDTIRDRFLIGSFQRDTLGSDLKSPKWQKGPELLVEILSALADREKILLLLAGPRRHYVISECESRGIPYLFCGHKPEPGKDDIAVNTLGEKEMALLYNLIDCYVVTSKSEGGPKAVIESSFCKTLLFSTDVGLAPDFLDARCI